MLRHGDRQPDAEVGVDRCALPLRSAARSPSAGQVAAAALRSRLQESLERSGRGQRPFGSFFAGSVRLPRPWIRSTRKGTANDIFDFGVIITAPRENGRKVADVVGGGLPIAFDEPRRGRYHLLGYPGEQGQMHGCEASSTGKDPVYSGLNAPATFGAGCFMAPGASGGPWLIDSDTKIAGLTSYFYPDRRRTFSPYFSKQTLGKLIAGL